MTTSVEATSTSLTGVLRFLLLLEALAGLLIAIVLTMLAAGVERGLGGDGTNIQFAAAGAFMLGLFAAIASRGVRRRRGWAWTMSAFLQVLIAIGTGIAILVLPWHPALLAGFALPTLAMIVLSTASVRHALGQA